ncbi:MAG: hypothetical protein Rubg2KO_39290 [Rubricoccaceae bacterium]
MRLPRLLLCLALSLTWAGCDTSELTDAERVVGRWEAASVNVRVGSALAVPVVTLGQGGSSGTLRIESRGAFDMEVGLGGKVIIPNTDVTINLPQEVDLSGTYMLDDVAKTMTVSRGPRSTTLRYDLTPFLGGGESIQFIAENADELVTLLDFPPEEAEAFFSVASGASLRFRRIIQ